MRRKDRAASRTPRGTSASSATALTSSSGTSGSRSCERGRTLYPHRLPFADEHVAEENARLVLIVRSATELDIVSCGGSSRRVRRDMVKLEERRLAATAHTPDKRAASFVALPHCTLNPRWYVASRCRSLVGVRSR